MVDKGHAGQESGLLLGLQARLGIPCLLLSGRGLESAGWTGSAAGAPGSAGSASASLAAVGGGPHPVPSASSFILTLP